MKRSPLARKTPIKATAIKASGRRMRQTRSTGKPTKAQTERFEAMRALGCIACRMNAKHGLPTAAFGPVKVLHAIENGKEIGKPQPFDGIDIEKVIAADDWHNHVQQRGKRK